MPELAPDEVLVAVMASGINYNTVWSAMFEPVPTFAFLRRYGRQGGYAARHDLDYQVVGSDASGVVVRVGVAVRLAGVRDPSVPPASADHMVVATTWSGGGNCPWRLLTAMAGCLR